MPRTPRRSSPLTQSPSLILASTSPRRIELLRQAGLDPRVIGPGTEEVERPGESPTRMVARLATEKAQAVAGRPDLPPGAVIIAADTTVVADAAGRSGRGSVRGGSRVLGKPRDAREAFEMLSRILGTTHTVLTGYCLIRPRHGRTPARKLTRVVRTRVKMRKLTPAEIKRYIATGEPMDKAGAYGAQGIGGGYIESISGSYTNVVGLPISQLMADLALKFGIRPGSSK